MKKRFLSFIIGGFLFLGINLNAFTYNMNGLDWISVQDTSGSIRECYWKDSL